MASVTLTALMLLCCVSCVARSQAATLSVGARARVQTTSHPKWLYGSVVSYDASTVLLDPCTACEGSNIPRANILRLQVSAGRTGRSYALEGAIVGVVTGVMLMHAVAQHSRQESGLAAEGPCGNPLCAIYQAEIAGGLFGGLLGTAAGAFMRRERWETINPR